MPYLEYTYYNKDSIVIPYIRKKIWRKIVQYIKFEDIGIDINGLILKIKKQMKYIR